MGQNFSRRAVAKPAMEKLSRIVSIAEDITRPPEMSSQPLGLKENLSAISCHRSRSHALA
jgi:hypothetical protein